MKSVLQRSILASAAIGALGIVGCTAGKDGKTGADGCERLTAKVCAELGEDCTLWRELGGAEKVVKGRDEPACSTLLENQLALDGLVTSERGSVLGERLKRAVAKGDQAETDAVKLKLEQNRKRIQAGLEKVKQQADP
jgi:hypothetical protein